MMVTSTWVPRGLRIAAVTALLYTPSCQVPAEVRPFAPGMQRSSVEGSFMSSETTDDFGGKAEEDSLTLAVSHGTFVNANIEIGGELAYFMSDYEDNFGFAGESSGFAVGAYGRYYFVTDATQRPFAEIGLGVGTMEYGGPSADLALISLGIGSMQMLSDHTALEVILRYSMVGIDIDGFELEQDTLSLFAGYSVFL